jgi:hypothetical protein
MDSESSFESSWLGQSAEWPKEYSEKQKDAYKKAQSQLQKTKKDEGKAQGDREVLFQILTRFIQNPYYEDFVPWITEILAKEVPARLIMSLISLVYPEAALHILTSLGRKKDVEILLSLHKYEKRVDLDESILHPSIRAWMNTWSYTSRIYLVDPTTSVVLSKKLSNFFEWKARTDIVNIFWYTILFFFTSRNVVIDEKKARSYAEFIISEYSDSLQAFLSWADMDLTNLETDVASSALFGLKEE